MSTGAFDTTPYSTTTPITTINMTSLGVEFAASMILVLISLTVSNSLQLAIGLLAVLILCNPLKSVGCDVNPLITGSRYINSEIASDVCLKTILAQIGGAIIGGLVYMIVYKNAIIQ